MIRAVIAAMALSLAGMLASQARAQTPAPSATPTQEEPAKVQAVSPLGPIELRPKGAAAAKPEATATTTPVPPTVSASWGARWQSYLGGTGQWVGGAMWDTGAYFADPALVVATDRLLQAAEGRFSIFFDPINGDDNPSDHIVPFSSWFSNLPLLPQGQVWYVERPQLLRNPACPDGLGNLRECEIMVVAANPSNQTDSLVVVTTNYWDGPVEFGNWNFAAWDVNQSDANASGTYVAGIWVGQTSNALIVSMDLNRWSDGTFKTSKVMILPKADLYPATSGQKLPARWFDNLQNSNGKIAFTVVPALTYLQTNATYMVNSFDASSAPANQLSLWTINTTDLSRPTLARSTLSVASFSRAPNADQAGTNVQVSTWDARIASVATSQSDALWVTHVTSCVPAPDTVKRACIRWYQINPLTNAVVQQNTIGAVGTHFYYPAIAANPKGAMTLVFSASATNSYVGVYFMGRRPTDLLNHLTGVYYLLQAGNGCYNRPYPGGTYSGGNYVGARSAVALDPTDNLSFWITGAFTGVGNSNCSSNGWGTWLGRLTW